MTAINRKTGSPIVGTLERLTGVVGVKNVKQGPGGAIKFEYDGSGTTIDWNSQKTDTDLFGLPLFVDEDGQTCRTTDIEFTTTT